MANRIRDTARQPHIYKRTRKIPWPVVIKTAPARNRKPNQDHDHLKPTTKNLKTPPSETVISKPNPDSLHHPDRSP